MVSSPARIAQASIYNIYYENSDALPCISKPTIKPKRPRTELKISITKIFTNLVASQQWEVSMGSCSRTGSDLLHQQGQHHCR